MGLPALSTPVYVCEKSEMSSLRAVCISSLMVVVRTVLQAQPVFTAANCFNVGDSTGLGAGASIVNIQDIIADTGGDHVWDYSAYNSGGPIYSWTSPNFPYQFEAGVNALQSPFHAFPIHEDPNGAGVALYRGFQYSVDLDTLYQMAWSASAGSFVLVNNPPLPYLTFPMDYQQVGEAFITNYFNTLPVSTTRRQWKYDGFGKIIMPYGEIDSVYRFHTVQRDSSLFDQTVIVLNELIWIQRSSGIPVLRFTENSGGGFNSYYTSAVTQQNAIAENVSRPLSVHPNPTRGEVFVGIPGSTGPMDGVVRVETSLGQLVSEVPVHGQSVRFDLSHVGASGVFFISMIPSGSAAVHRARVLVE